MIQERYARVSTAPMETKCDKLRQAAQKGPLQALAGTATLLASMGRPFVG